MGCRASLEVLIKAATDLTSPKYATSLLGDSWRRGRGRGRGGACTRGRQGLLVCLMQHTSLAFFSSNRYQWAKLCCGHEGGAGQGRGKGGKGGEGQKRGGKGAGEE